MRYGQWPLVWEVNEVWAMASNVGGELGKSNGL